MVRSLIALKLHQLPLIPSQVFLHKQSSFPPYFPHLILSLSLTILFTHFNFTQMEMLNFFCIFSLIISLFLLTVEARIPGVYSGGSWQTAHATFYGGSDASGTMGMSPFSHSKLVKFQFSNLYTMYLTIEINFQLKADVYIMWFNCCIILTVILHLMLFRFF